MEHFKTLHKTASASMVLEKGNLSCLLVVVYVPSFIHADSSGQSLCNNVVSIAEGNKIALHIYIMRMLPLTLVGMSSPSIFRSLQSLKALKR